MKNTAIRICRHDRNYGKGSALKTGISKANGDVILIQDADLEYDPEEYPVLINPILKEKPMWYTAPDSPGMGNTASSISGTTRQSLFDLALQHLYQS